MISDVLAEAKEKMRKAVEVAKDDFSGVRTGRANPRSSRSCSWTTTALRRRWGSLPGCTTATRGRCSITPYDKGALKEIEKTIVAASNLGASVGNDGTVVRATLPELTQDRRKEFVKIVRGKGEDAKVAIRNIRRKAKDDLDALKADVGDDEVARAEKELEAATKAQVDAIDEALRKKEAELLEV